MAEAAGLSYETARHHCTVLHLAVAANDEVIKHYSLTDYDWSFLLRAYASVVETQSSFDEGRILDFYSRNMIGVDDRNVIAYSAGT